MPHAIPAIIVAVAAAAGATATTLAIIQIVALVATLAIAAQEASAAKGKAKRRARSVPRDVTIRSTTAPVNIIYGRARVSGPIVYPGVCHSIGSTNNSELWFVIPFAGHECDGFEDVWVDDKHTPASQITAGGGAVLSGSPFYNGGPLAYFYFGAGTSTQIAMPELLVNFPADITIDFRLRGYAYIAARFIGANNSRKMFPSGPPQQVRALVRGKKIYDPRRDPSSVHYKGAGAQSISDSSTWEWSSNPALCVADYLRDVELGMGASDDEINWALVEQAAEHCDETVSTPDGPEKRYTFNGALSAADTHRENLTDLLSAMNGRLGQANGLYEVRAGQWTGDVVMHIGVDDLAGDVTVQTATPIAQRYNTVRSVIYDAEQGYQETAVAAMSNDAYLARDGGEVLFFDMSLPGTESAFMAQRLAFKKLAQSDRQLTAVVPMTLRGMQLSIGDVVTLTIPELLFDARTFRVSGWRWDQERGIEVTLTEDDELAYADPLVTDYIVQGAPSTPTPGSLQVPPPTALTAVAGVEGIHLSWTLPENFLAVHRYDVYASPTSAWSGAVLVGSTTGNSRTHFLGSTGSYWYWVVGADVFGNLSTRAPNSDTSTVTATFTAVLFATPSAPQSLGGIDGTPATGQLTGSFSRNGVTVASRVFTATHSAGTLTYSAGADTGEATTHTATGSGTATLVVTHTHTGSGQTTTLTFTVA